MAAVKLGGGCDVSSVRLKAATCSQKKLGNSSLFGLEVGGSSQLNRGLKLATPNKRARSIGISMNRSDKFSSQPGNEDTTDQEPMLFTEQALKFYKCLEKNYESTVEVASIWYEISVRAVGKENYNYAHNADFISRSLYDMALLIKEKADGLKLFVENEIDHTEATMSLLLEMNAVDEEAHKNVAQDGGPLKLIRGLTSGIRMDVIDHFCQAEIEDAIKHSIAEIVESMHTIHSAALDMHSCLQDNYEKAVDVASVWHGESLSAARVEDYSYARKAYFVSQFFYDSALLTKAEADALELFIVNRSIQSEAAINLLREMPAIQVDEDKIVSQG